MSTIMMRDKFFNSSPLGPIHALETLKGMLSLKVVSDAEQVKLTVVPSYSGKVKGLMVSASSGGGTNEIEGESKYIDVINISSNINFDNQSTYTKITECRILYLTLASISSVNIVFNSTCLGFLSHTHQ